jgi:alanyl aminopeptidase
MRFYSTWLAALTVLFAECALGAGQPPKLRLSEVQNISPTSYKVALTLNPLEDTFSGSIEIQLDIQQSTDTIWLNGNKLEIADAGVHIPGQRLSATVLPGGDDFIGFHFGSALPVGSAIMEISYNGRIRSGVSAGIFRSDEEGNHYLFTQFESTDARDAFPCFDEPSYKVPWSLTLHIPARVHAVSNTPIENEILENENHTIVFKRTKPLPSYLVAFAVGPFEFVEAGFAGRNHVPVRIITPKGKADQAKYAAEVTATILTRLEDYFGIPYPYEKSDQLAIPVTFGFGAMENAGLVTYSQNLLLANPATDTIARQRGYAGVAAHELAHQWFGDLVTTAWWNDIWLNEAFATWMSGKILAEWHPEWSTRMNEVGAKLGAEGQDSLVSARKIRQEIESKNDISNAFDGITYQKGAAVIGMFESYMGTDNFRRGIQSYMKRYAFKNATAGDFLDAVSTGGKKNVTQAFSSFLNQAGVPLVSLSLDCKGGLPVVHLEQRRYVPLGSAGAADQIWQIPICMRVGTGTAGEKACTLLTQPAEDYKLKFTGCPTWIEGNDHAVGYYRTDYQAGLLNALVADGVDERLDAAERVDFMGNAEALLGAGKLSAAQALGLVNVFHADPERQVVQSALSVALRPWRHEVPESLTANYQRFLLKNFQARAREIGWIAKPGESDDVKLLRPVVVRAIATIGGDRELAAQAQALAVKWFDNHGAIEPDIVPAVLGVAAYYGDKALFDKFLEAYKASKDRQERQRILGAMTSFRDPAALEAGYNAVLSGDVPFIQGTQLLFAGQGQEATHKLAFAFLKAHYDEIVAKRPQGGGSDFGARLPAVGSSYCDAQSKQELQAFFAPRIDKFTGGPRSLSQTLERIDVCIAEKSSEEAGVKAFLEQN